jgi:hypothetical protein
MAFRMWDDGSWCALRRGLSNEVSVKVPMAKDGTGTPHHADSEKSRTAGFESTPGRHCSGPMTLDAYKGDKSLN